MRDIAFITRVSEIMFLLYLLESQLVYWMNESVILFNVV